jgi:menaquinone-dependent protoporphyrinogen oxidase
MKVLVAYATRHGATRGIAERIAQTLEQRGLEVTLYPVERVGPIEGYDAFVIGSAAYMGTWLKDASEFVRKHERQIASRPVWLFSSGPIGTDRVDKKGQDVVKASEPAEFRTFEPLLHPRDEQVFFGAWDTDAEPAGFADRFVRGFTSLFPGVKAAMPTGDFRDWPEIEAWAETIARDLEPVPIPSTPA